MDKKLLRSQMRSMKKALSEAQICRASEKLTQAMKSHPLYQNAQSIYGYLSYNEEVRTEPLLRQAQAEGKRIAVPKIVGDVMEFHWLDWDHVEIGYKGIPEPTDGHVADDPTALVLMPGLAFDRHGHRIGYGGGFYDRFLEKEAHPTLALCYDFQLLDFLQTEEFDIPVDVVLSASTEEAE